VKIDPEQLEFLMSQAIDGDISAEDAERLERCLADDPEARAEFEKMQRLNALIGQWGQRSVPVDDERVGDALAARVEDDAEFAISRALDGEEQAERDMAAFAQRDPDLGLVEHQYRRLEMMVRAWGEVEPAVDHDRLFQRLCETIRAEADQQRKAAPRILRLYAPLAAAASLAIVAGIWLAGRSTGPVAPAGPPRIEIALAGPPIAPEGAKPVMEFSFGLADDAPVQTLAKASGGGSGVVISIGGFTQTSGEPAQESMETVF
jgi:hypothetical protein